jgi:hypothetical protein
MHDSDTCIVMDDLTRQECDYLKLPEFRVSDTAGTRSRYTSQFCSVTSRLLFII